MKSSLALVLFAVVACQPAVDGAATVKADAAPAAPASLSYYCDGGNAGAMLVQLVGGALSLVDGVSGATSYAAAGNGLYTYTPSHGDKMTAQLDAAMQAGQASGKMTTVYGTLNPESYSCALASDAVVAQWQRAVSCDGAVTKKISDAMLADYQAQHAHDPQVGSDGDSDIVMDLSAGTVALIVHLQDTSDEAGGEWPGHDVIKATLTTGGTSCDIATQETIESFM